MRIHISAYLAAALSLVAACSSETNPSSGATGGQGGQGGQGSQTSSATDASSVASGTGGTGGDPGPVAKPPPFDLVGIVGTGQSLSVGVSGSPAVSTMQPYKNLKLVDAGTDPKYDGMGDQLSLAPLTEPIRPQIQGLPSGPYPNNIYGETIHAGMANQITATAQMLGGFEYTTVHSVVGESGKSISVIKKEGTGKAYAATLYEASAIKELAKAEGKTYGIAAITLTHGETDSGDPQYGEKIRQLWADYNTDLPAITGQTGVIPLLVTQQGTVPDKAGLRSASTIAQWKLGVDYPGEILCVGPKYQYGYAGDHLHLDAVNYVRLGEKNAEVFLRATMLGEAWKPLQPKSLARTGAKITIEFDVPNPPLAWEETIPPPHQAASTYWAKGRGFEVEDSTGPLTIASVAIAGQSVEIELSEEPKGQALVVRYAMTQDVDGFTGGTAEARRGQLRDSDPFIGRDQQTIPCKVTSGSTTVTAEAGAFALRTVGDLVSGGGLPEGTVIVAKKSATEVTLSQSFPGADGAADLTFHYDHRNYAVHFELAE